MIQCKECGAEMDVFDEYCPNCGATNEWGKGSGLTYRGDSRNAAEMPNNEYVNAEDSRGVAFLSYIGLLLIVPILKAKDSEFIRFHVNQGIIVQLFNLICDCTMLGLVNLSIHFDRLYSQTLDNGYQTLTVVMALLTLIVFIISFICWIVPLRGSLRGVRQKAPIIGNIRLIK